MFGGSIQSMRSILRDNRNLLPKSGRKKKLKLGTSSVLNNPIQTPTASKEMLESIRLKAKRKSIRKNLILFFILLLAGIIFFFTMKEMGVNNQEQKIYIGNYTINEARLELKKKQEKYQFFILDAESWMEQANYHNAIIQYSNALDVFPNSKALEIRLAHAYIQECITSNKFCDSAHKLLDSLNQKYPTDPRALYLSNLLEGLK